MGSILPLNLKPTITISNATTSNVVAEYMWDFTINDFVLKDGKFQIVTGLQALEIWVTKAMLTQKNVYAAYSSTYGQEFDKLIGQGFSRALVEAELKRLTLECVTKNSNVTGIDNFSVSFIGDTLTINFKLITTLGTTNISYS